MEEEKMMGRLGTLGSIKSLFVAGIIVLALGAPARAQVAPGTITAFNDWLVQARSPLDASHRDQDSVRLKYLLDNASVAPWMSTADRDVIQQDLLAIAYYVNYDHSARTYPPELQGKLQHLANTIASVRAKLVQANGGREVLDQRNLPSGTGSGTTNPPATTTPPANTGSGQPGTAGVTPGSGPGSLLGVGSGTGPSGTGTGTGTTPSGTGTGNAMSTPRDQAQDLINRAQAAGFDVVSVTNDPNNANNVIIVLRPRGQGTGTGTPGSTQPGTTGNTTSTAPGTSSTGTANGAGNRGSAKGSLANALAALQSLLSDDNLNNGAMVGVSANGTLACTSAGKDSLSDIAALINRPPLSDGYASDVSAIVSQMQAIANANFGPNYNGAFQQANRQIAAARDQIFAKINALNARIDSGQ